MASTTCQIEEIPREELSVPQIHLQIIHLNSSSLNGDASGGSLQQFNRKPIVLKRLHKLQSFDYLLQESNEDHASSGLRSHLQNRRGSSRKAKSVDNDEKSENIGSIPHREDDESVYVLFVKGLNSTLAGDKDKILKSLAQMLNKHTVSVAANEYKLFCRPSSSSTKSTLKHVCLHTGMLAVNEMLDEGAVDVSRYGLVGAAQCLALTLYFNKNLASMGRNVWNSRVAQFLTDTWMSFGCVAAVVIASRQ
ncbi:uncharacterized protein [Penaeus vannamei]|uniref:uncharacterized protein n=1 Tax=Penaeus vannamei TaxID=6689 RepID=UPI000F6720AE|nr:uncharacterized protein LOC113819545 [Penaeus vannamei]